MKLGLFLARLSSKVFYPKLRFLTHIDQDLGSKQMSMIPTFNAYTVLIEPWTSQWENTWPILLMGFFVAAGCSLIGNYMILRKMALVGDAISHSLLPGIAIAFLIANSRELSPLFLGALASAMLTVILIEFIQKHSKIKPDAAIGIVFTSLFALGIVIITLFADHIDLDTDCVLYGELAFIPLMKSVVIGGIDFGPYPIMRMGSIFFGLLAIVVFFYNPLLVSTFDPILAKCMGIRPALFKYGLTLILAIVLVSAFRSVGSILVVAMLLFPGCTARLLSDNLKTILKISIALCVFYAILGLHLATFLNCSIAGAMTVAASFLFGIVWIFKKPRFR